MRPTREQLLDLLGIVAATESREIYCEEFLARVGALLERLQEGREPSPELRQVAQHAKVCPPCREELELLIDLHLGS